MSDKASAERRYAPARYRDGAPAMQIARGRFCGTLVCRRQCVGFLFAETVCGSKQRFPEHSHELAYVSIVLKGRYAEHCHGKTWEHEAGQLIFHVPGESHWDHMHEEAVHVLNVEVTSSQLARLKTYGIAPTSRMVFEDGYMVQLGRKLHRELQNSDPASRLALEGLSLELLAEVFRVQALRAEERPGDWPSHIMEILQSRYKEPLTMGELASLVGVHPVSIARAFRRRYLCSVGEYVRRLRVEAACHEIVNSDLPIVEVATRSGFFDQSHLCRMIRQYTGMSPSALRKTRSIALPRTVCRAQAGGSVR